MFNTAAAVEGSAVIHVLFPILVELKDAGGVRAIFFIRELSVSFLFYASGYLTAKLARLIFMRELELIRILVFHILGQTGVVGSVHSPSWLLEL